MSTVVKAQGAVKRKRPAWVWAVAVAGLMSVTGCGMYPSHPGLWPKGIWGDILKDVSHVIDFVAHWFGPHGNYGLALIIVTVAVRLLIMPLFIKQIQFSRNMQQMQPQIAEIRNRHKGDNQRIQQETMKLYQEIGFNPMAGCLPMVVQLPILYALFGAIEGNVALNHSTFLGIFQLGQHDKYFILPILAGITTYMSSRVMMTGSPNQGQQKMMLLMMPVFVFFMATRFPAGLSLYWIVTNLFTAVQGYFIKARPAQKEALATAGASTAAVMSSRPAKPSRPRPESQPSKEAKGAGFSGKLPADRNRGNPKTSAKTQKSRKGSDK